MKKITRDNLPHLLWRSRMLMKTHIDTFASRRLAWWWKVSLGNHCLFRGLPVIRRYPGSKILVGDDCTFNSAFNANQGGISRPCILWTLSNNARLCIGDGSGFSGTVINAELDIRIGRNVRCGTNTQIMDSDMHTDDKRVNSPSPIVLEDGVWLGMNSVVLKGVSIGEGTLIGANSLVIKSVPKNVVAAGIPARVIREL